ncbi:MAG: universal stress protein [Actinomycetes bacterium]
MSTEVDAGPGLIVVGVDGSDSSANALAWALEHAASSGMRVRAIACWQALDSYALAEANVPESVFEDQAQARLRQSMDLAAYKRKQTTAADEAVVVETAVLRGNPAPTLIEASKQANLLVVGNRGHGGFIGMLLGSVAQHCAAHSKCPVVVVHDRES